jgi:hypothetical protein
MFSVHQDLLSASSKYFKAAFEGEFREAKSKSIPLPDTIPKEFRRFLDWLYFRRLPEIPDLIEDSDDKDADMECLYCGKDCPSFSDVDVPDKDEHSDLSKAYPQFPQLPQQKEEKLEAYISKIEGPNTRLYAFADRYDVPALRQAIVEYIWYWYSANDEDIPSYATIVIIGDLLPISSPFYRLLVDLFVDRYCLEEENVAGCPGELALRQKLPYEFIFAVMGGLSNMKNKVPGQGLKELCAYHEHPKDETSIKACTQAKKEGRNRMRKIMDLEDKAERKKPSSFKGKQ